LLQIIAQVHRDRLSEQGGNGVADKLDFLGLISKELEIQRKCLEDGTFPYRQDPMFGRMKKVTQSTACDRLGRFIATKSSKASGRSPALLRRSAVHDSPECSSSVTLVPKLFGQVAHALPRLEHFCSSYVTPC
jgi:hypothetical protein